MFAKTSKAPITAVGRACPACGSLNPSHTCPTKTAATVPPSTAPKGK